MAATIESPAPAGSAAREIRDLTLAEAEQMLRSIGERPFRARQIMGWLWQRGAESFEAMTDLPARIADLAGLELAARSGKCARDRSRAFN